ncbi:MAG: ABC transporter ATP-binding protein [Bacteroidota bacterium]|nr:ABC transporter ATP-binding protein [Bacteroidota bacterium]MDP4213439.1 ABC transporter ATP-binding protein [Bacteroidota bacterium]MDP4251809.1 ABC transporter ATP-binding protein [Bacteroidota bacterium]
MIHLLEADSIQLEFNRRKILSSVYVKCETGKITGLLGRNGQGKSCLMNIIYGSLKCEKSVRVNGIAYSKLLERPDLLRFQPQFHFIPGHLSMSRIFNDFQLDFAHFSKWFPEYASKYKSAVGELSGGGQKLMELYAIVKAPALFAMLDEPFTHLSPLHVEKAKDLLLEAKSDKGLLITDHLFRHLTGISDSLYVLANGETHLTKSLDDIEELGYAKL